MTRTLRITVLIMSLVLLLGGAGLLRLSIHVSNVEATMLDDIFEDMSASITESSRKKSTNQGNPFDGEKLFVSADTDASRTADAWEKTRPKDAALMRKIASAPVAVWFGDWNGKVIDREVRETVKSMREKGALPVLVAYNIPNRNCGLYSAGGAEDAEAYITWITSMAKGIGRRSAVVILEPDALSEGECVNKEQAEQTRMLLGKAVEILKSKPRISVYIDAGNAQWISVEDMAGRLKSVHIEKADGFALNISNFLKDTVNIAYGEKLSALVGGKHFLIDTSRNGRGPALGFEWCNPTGRALGRLPTTETGHPLVDAFLWIKQPGESDGECNGGPPAGVWWPEYALGLAQRAR